MTKTNIDKRFVMAYVNFVACAVVLMFDVLIVIIKVVLNKRKRLDFAFRFINLN